MYSKIKTMVEEGIELNIIEIEANISRGMFAFSVIGVSSKFEREIREKVRSVFKLLNKKLPNKRIIINIQNSNRYVDEKYIELPIILSVLQAMEIVKKNFEYICVGQVNLNGDIEEVDNHFKYIQLAEKTNQKIMILPYTENIYKLEHCNCRIFYAKNIIDIINFLNKSANLIEADTKFDTDSFSNTGNINDILGQKALLRALIIAVTGRHHTLISGVSGSGKTISINSLSSVLPAMYEEDLLDVNANNYEGVIISRPPIITSDHSMKVGDIRGTRSNLGMISKANKCFLFMDEINLYSNLVLNNLREVMEERDFYIKAKEKEIKLESSLTLLATMNPCNCGNFGSKINKCTCTPGEIARYQRKISKPFKDRFHIHVEVDYQANEKPNNFDINLIRKNIENAWLKQRNRYADARFKYNGLQNYIDMNKYIKLNTIVLDKINELTNYYKLSIRQKHNIIKISRTIADYANEDEVAIEHVYEAFSYQKIID